MMNSLLKGTIRGDLFIIWILHVLTIFVCVTNTPAGIDTMLEKIPYTRR